MNGSEREVAESSATIEALLAELGYGVPVFAVSLNGEFVRREDYAASRVAEGDSIEIYNLFAGG